MARSGTGRLLEFDDGDGYRMENAAKRQQQKLLIDLQDTKPSTLQYQGTTDVFDPLARPQAPESVTPIVSANEIISAVKSRSVSSIEPDEFGSPREALDSASSIRTLLDYPATIESTSSTGGGDTLGLNGFIRHENVGKQRSQTAAQSSISGRKKGAPFVDQDLGSPALNLDSTSSSDTDDVFSSQQPLNLRGNSNRLSGIFSKGTNNKSGHRQKRVHFSKATNKVATENMEPPGLQDYVLPGGAMDARLRAKILRGTNCRTRITCLCSLVCAFLLAGSLVTLVLWLTNALPSMTFSSVTAVCPKLRAQHLLEAANNVDGRVVIGHMRVVQLPDKKWLALIPFGEGCASSGCDVSSIMAFDGSTLQHKWVFECAGPEILAFDCRIDISKDGIVDCSVTTADPPMVEFINGVSGVSLGRIVPDGQRDSAVSLMPPIPMADINNDDTPEFLYIISNAYQRYVQFQIVLSQGSVNFKNTYDLVKISNATTSQAPILWQVSEGVQYIGVVLDRRPGLFVWDAYSMYRVVTENVRPMFPRYRFANPIGAFVDIDMDGILELVACVNDGHAVVALDAKNTTLWTHRSEDWACEPNSVTPALVLLHKQPAIVVTFHSVHTSVVETWVLDGKNGVRRHNFARSASHFHAVPLIGRLTKTGGQDRIVTWRAAGNKIQLIGCGYPWHNVSVLYESELRKPPESVTDQDALYKMSVLNQRYTGALVPAKNGSLEMFFVTNTYEGKLTAHKLRLTCDCTNTSTRQLSRKRTCAKFNTVSQPWGMLGGIANDYTCVDH